MTRPVLAVLGGSFNPPHIGHAMIPAYLMSRGLADRVLVAPTYSHALGKSLRPFEERMGLTRAAMGHYGEAVVVSAVERERAQAGATRPSYTLHLLELLENHHPGERIRLVVGSDIIETGETAKWHRWDRIEARFDPIVVPRAGYGEAEGALPEVSSSRIRTLLERHGPQHAALEALVPAVVLRRLRAPARPDAVAVFGQGHVAHHFTRWLQDKGLWVERFAARESAQWSFDMPLQGALLLTRDADLPRLATALAGRLAPSVPVLHAAGSLIAARALAPLVDAGHSVGTLHPICSLRREHDHRYLERAGFGIEGAPAARAWAEQLVAGATVVALDEMDGVGRASYHAACALAANHLAVLRQAAVSVLGPASAAAVDVLLASSLDNLRALGVPAGVTGPVSRGDHETVARHLSALRQRDHEAAARLYEVLSEALAAVLSGPAE